MPVTLSWFDKNQTIIVYSIEGAWTWTEFHEADQPTWNLIELADYRIDIIIDLSQIKGLPLGIPGVMQRAGEDVVPRDQRLIIVVGGPGFVKILLGAMRRLYPNVGNVYRHVNKLDEAIKMLEQERGEVIIKSISPFK